MDEGLMNDSRGVEGMVRPLVSEPPVGDSLQIAVYERNQLLERSPVPLRRLMKEAGDLTGRWCIREQGSHTPTVENKDPTPARKRGRTRMISGWPVSRNRSCPTPGTGSAQVVTDGWCR